MWYWMQMQILDITGCRVIFFKAKKYENGKHIYPSTIFIVYGQRLTRQKSFWIKDSKFSGLYFHSMGLCRLAGSKALLSTITVPSIHTPLWMPSNNFSFIFRLSTVSSNIVFNVLFRIIKCSMQCPFLFGLYLCSFCFLLLVEFPHCSLIHFNHSILLLTHV